MKRSELIEKLIKEGLSEKTLSKLSDKMIEELSERMLGEETVMISKANPNFQKDLEAAKKAKKTIETYEEHGVSSKVTKGHNNIPEFMDSEKLKEEKPSAGLSKEKKSEVVKKAIKGKDIGKKGKSFKDIEKKAKESGADDPKAVAASAMWKNIKRESVEEKNVKNWIKNLAEEKFFHILTSKNEIMEMIDSKINEVEKFPEMFKWDTLKSMNSELKEQGTTTKPVVKPKVDPSTKPKHPLSPGKFPKQKPKAQMEESK